MTSSEKNRCLRLTSMVAVIGVVLFWLYRFASGAALTDANRLVLLGGLWWMAYPFVLGAAGCGAARARRRQVLRRLHAIVVESPWRCAFMVGFTWLITHTFLAATLARTEYGWDLIFVVQAAHNAFSGPATLWKTIEGSQSYFSHHFVPYLYLFWPVAQLPLAAAWFSLIQDLANVAFLAWSIILIRNYIPSRIIRLVLIGCLVANPFWTGVIHYEFHEYGFAPLLGLALWRAYVHKSLWGWLGACVGILALKETIAISVAWSGLLLIGWSVWKRQVFTAAAGISALLLSTAALVGYFGFILPLYVGKNVFRFDAYYHTLGTSIGEIALSPLRAPTAFAAALFTRANANWLLVWSAALGGLGLCGWYWLLFLGPEIAIVVLASISTIKSTIYQYGGPFMAVAVIMLLTAGQWLLTHRRQRLRLLSGMLLVACLVSTWAVPDRLRSLVSPLGFPSIPFVLRQRGEVPAATNSAAGAMHLAQRLELEVRFPLPNQPDLPQLIVDGQHARYLIDERLPFRLIVPVREVDRCGPYRVVVPVAAAP